MPRRKQVSPMQRIDSGEVLQHLSDTPRPSASLSKTPKLNGYTNGAASPPALPPRKSSLSSSRLSQPIPSTSTSTTKSTALTLLVCTLGIYASFLTWSLLQERITKTAYPLLPSSFFSPAHSTPGSPPVEYFRYPIFINTIQALFAFVTGSIYLLLASPASILFVLDSRTTHAKQHSAVGWYLPIDRRAILPVFGVSTTQVLASPFGYASLNYVSYVTFILAKSCKLLPVMAVQVVWFRRRYTLSKYLVVVAVTAGVAVFTLFSPVKAGKKSGSSLAENSVYGLGLLAVNLLFDGVTNASQDAITRQPEVYGRVDGKQLMVSCNLFQFALQAIYLVLLPLVPAGVLSFLVSGATGTEKGEGELQAALAFCARHPRVLYDILGFCVAGAVGQLFIFATLERFGSLQLVKITVTRKMLSMILSVVVYGHRLGWEQWGGVGLVFGGVLWEAYEASRKGSGKVKDR